VKAFACLLAALTATAFAQNAPYKNPKLPVKERVSDLLHRMTTEEKIWQLRCESGPKIFEPALKTTGIGFLVIYPWRSDTPGELAKRLNAWQEMAKQSRLGIPPMVEEEALHGLIDKGHTSFPQAIAMAATWDPELVNQVSRAIADETVNQGVRQVLSPVINVVRDARWGRVEETYGEDPYLTSRLAVGFVSGFEKSGIATTPKHFVANLWDGGRDSNSVHISMSSLFNTYMPPFQAAFQDAGASSVMCSYNAVNGVPCASDPWLLTDILRKKWGFPGYVVSDWGAASNVFNTFHVVGSEEDAAAALVNAGMESEHPGIYIYGKPLDDAVRSGKISGKILDTAVSRVLTIKFEKGLFDHPIVDPAKAAASAVDPAHTALAKQVATRSMVLLKNDRNTLPLSKAIHRVAVFGDVAIMPSPLGGYSGSGNHEQVKGILAALKEKCPDTTFDFVQGSSMGAGKELPAIPASSFQTEGGTPGLTAEYSADADGANVYLKRIDPQLNFDWGDGAPDAKVPQDHFFVKWTGYLTSPEDGTYAVSATSDDGMRVYVNGQLVADNWGDHSAQSVIGRITLKAGEKVPLKVLYYEGTGEAVAKLGWQKEGAADTLLGRVTQTAAAAESSIVFATIREGEGQDRSYLKLPGNQEDVIKAAADGAKPVIVVLVAGSPVTMEGWVDRAPAILDAWYPGQEGADAIADVLFGDANPSGKLPITFPKTVGQCPLYYNFEPSGRGYDYVDGPGTPLFPFGHGLSYTSFKYSNLVVEGDGPYSIRVDVTNTGSRAGTEVVQLYVHQQVATLIQPLKSLKGFKAVTLGPGETQTVTMPLGFDTLSYWDNSMHQVLEPGVFDVMVGSSSDDIRVKKTLTVTQGKKR
jgi:beta-glucosidase